ncbi:MAG: PEP-CTERM sorting domain-containing protein [Planctomycetota bacterium]
MHKQSLLLASAGVLAVSTVASAQVLNEIRISSPGGSDDTSNFVEIAGTPGTDLSSLTLLAISAEFAPGQVDFAVPLTGAIPADGFWLLSSGDDDAVADQIGGPDFFGSPVSFIITDNFEGLAGDDLDADDDGVLDDPSVIGNILDAVSLTDGDATTDIFFGGGPVVGPDGTFPAALVLRTPDITGDFTFVPGAFGDDSLDTPGVSNVIPEPASIALLGVAGLGLLRRRSA